MAGSLGTHGVTQAAPQLPEAAKISSPKLARAKALRRHEHRDFLPPSGASRPSQSQRIYAPNHQQVHARGKPHVRKDGISTRVEIRHGISARVEQKHGLGPFLFSTHMENACCPGRLEGWRNTTNSEISDKCKLLKPTMSEHAI